MDSKLKLKIIIASTRPGRKGHLVGAWVVEKVEKFGHFEIEVLDLAQINLPMFDETNHPTLRTYEHQHTKDWSAKISDGDAFLVVSPEYNHTYPPSLINALDYVYHEWSFKPLAFVGYGGPSGGMLAYEHLKAVVVTFDMMPIKDMVHIPVFKQYITDDTFNPPSTSDKSVEKMLTSLLKWGEGLRTMRRNQAD